MRKFFSILILLIGLPLSTGLIWLGYSELVLSLVWRSPFDSIKAFYLLFGLIGIILFYILVTWGLGQYAKLTGWILIILSIAVILFVANFQTLPFVRSLSTKEFSTEFMNTVAAWRANITRQPFHIYPELVQEWQTIELANTVFGTALAVLLLLTGFRGLFTTRTYLAYIA